MSYITKFYQQRKQRIVYVMGGECALCGYKKNMQALEIQKEKEKTEYFCIDCGKKISYKANRCQKCAELHNRIVERPNREVFKKEIREQPFTALGRKYGVSDNAIRKWCDGYNLPRTKKEINSYRDLEWQAL